MYFFAFVAALLAGAVLYSRSASASVSPTLSPDVNAPKQTSRTRGERNNNPGNLRDTATRWRGETGLNDDPAFEEFDTPEDGIRALALLLVNYQRNLGLRTLRQIISRYAPPNENDTEAYIRAVSTATGFTASTPITLTDPDSLRVLVRAIIQHENGRVIYSDEQIALAVSFALV